MITPYLFLQDLHIAYRDARKHKRNTHTQLAFEQHLEDNLIQLYDELSTGSYEI
jgi:hypothetical protein